MTEIVTKRRKTVKDWLFLLVKILACFAVFFMVAGVVMMNMGGNSEIYRDTIEGYIVEGTGYDAQIGTFHSMTFFPVLGIDFEDLELRAQPGDTAVAASIGRVQIAFNFSDVMLSNGKIRYFNIEDGYALPGVLGENEIKLERASIVEANDGTAALKVRGEIGPHKALIDANMESFGSGRNKNFRFGHEKSFTVSLGDASASGTLSKLDEKSVLKDFSVLYKSQEVLKADLAVSKTNGPDVNISGKVTFSPRQTVLVPDLSYREKDDTTYMEGKIASDAVYAEDLDAESRFASLIKFLNSIFGDPKNKDIKLNAEDIDADIILSFAKIMEGGTDRGPLEQTVHMDDVNIIIKPSRDFKKSYVLEKDPVKAAPPL